MLKEERQNSIVKLVQKNNIVQVSELTDLLDVTEMTIRRDLKELEEKSLLSRIHGGAKINEHLSLRELSHIEKRKQNIDEKIYIAKKIVDQIEDGETIFLGAGSTIEMVSDFIKNKACRIVTNSYFLFNKIYNYKDLDIILIGGNLRTNTGAFGGSFALNQVESLRFKRAFIGVNGINDKNVFTFSETEASIQKLALDNSAFKYLVADHTKINKEDFYNFYNLESVDFLISDDKISKESVDDLNKSTKVIC